METDPATPSCAFCGAPCVRVGFVGSFVAMPRCGGEPCRAMWLDARDALNAASWARNPMPSKDHLLAVVGALGGESPAIAAMARQRPAPEARP